MTDEPPSPDTAAAAARLLREAMNARSLSASELADEAGVSGPLVTELLDARVRPRRQPAKLRKLSEFLWGQPDILSRVLRGEDVTSPRARAPADGILERLAERVSRLEVLAGVADMSDVVRQEARERQTHPGRNRQGATPEEGDRPSSS